MKELFMPEKMPDVGSEGMKPETVLDKFKKPEDWGNENTSNPFICYGKQETSADSFRMGFLPKTGEWTGEKGDSTWKPEKETIPDPENGKKGNPDRLTWAQILEKYGIEGIEFKDGYPDFSPVSQGEVEIDDFTQSRDKNFAQADEKLAEQWTKENKDGKEWTPRDVYDYRKENNLTWHEKEDCKTMQLVPAEIHNNTPHAGGISEIKKQNAEA